MEKTSLARNINQDFLPGVGEEREREGGKEREREEKRRGMGEGGEEGGG